jgi:acetolactate synthase-1/3 small subunit
MILEVTGPEAKIDSIAEMLQPYGIIEMVRTGLVAMVRGSGHFTGFPPDHNDNEESEAVRENDCVSSGDLDDDAPLSRRLGM